MGSSIVGVSGAWRAVPRGADVRNDRDMANIHAEEGMSRNIGIATSVKQHRKTLDALNQQLRDEWNPPVGDMTQTDRLLAQPSPLSRLGYDD